MYHFFQQIFTQVVVIDVPSKSLILQGILNFCMEEYKIKTLGFRSVSRKSFQENKLALAAQGQKGSS